MAENRTLIMRANRTLGAGLVDANLIRVEDLGSANERLLEGLDGDDSRRVSLLSILTWDLKVMREQDMLQHIVDEHGVGLIDLRTLEPSAPELEELIDIDLCWATWTVPFDKVEDCVLLASAYYLSSAVRTAWESRLGGRVLWYATTIEVVSEALDRRAAGAGEGAISNV